jgi:hypothetical protein
MTEDDPRTLTFRGEIVSARGGGAGVMIPAELIDTLGGQRQMRVVGSLNGVSYSSSTMPGPWGLFLGVHKATQQAAGVIIGDIVEVEVTRDLRPRVVELPPELDRMLAADPDLRARFDALAFTHRKEMATAIAEAKRPETRERRLAAIEARLRAQ